MGSQKVIPSREFGRGPASGVARITCSELKKVKLISPGGQFPLTVRGCQEPAEGRGIACLGFDWLGAKYSDDVSKGKQVAPISDHPLIAGENVGSLCGLVGAGWDVELN